ncbi:MAG: ribosome-associated translation inhibitor RaiA [Bacteroidales bacterium]|jgi:putative sigma-54 modulation protein|nr:ribosome-associated translation inhibitor RaiA [Bacteroidales bacterium]MDI9576404.1 ribosome-associated translation inhibitor RaiA [Bacteroidota bacterium]MDD2593588.1 ribosome-associated translation inhibitor RaiA [Bacteroidales bacterium]MDD3755452.1 ribosome-associated translation inhibitor RaiA [Bacteroidales bacterium]MDY0400581.1 ribosome-associated translation inhibitor RaiA [Bacteroidales bacterium]
MKVNINPIHFKTDKKLDEYITDKINKLSKFHQEIISSEVILKLDNTSAPENKIVEIRLIIAGNDLFAIKKAKTFEEATDLAVDALRRQIEKTKDNWK